MIHKDILYLKNVWICIYYFHFILASYSSFWMYLPDHQICYQSHLKDGGSHPEFDYWRYEVVVPDVFSQSQIHCRTQDSNHLHSKLRSFVLQTCGGLIFGQKKSDLPTDWNGDDLKYERQITIGPEFMHVVKIKVSL